jgi:serine/threonine protein kinase
VTSHKNLVSLIGVVTSGVPLLLLISFCENGSLQSYLRKTWEGNKPVQVHEKLKMMGDVARGMAHLVDARFIHRDLAARNVLVDSSLTCKVADFGLSRAGATTSEAQSTSTETYYRSKTGVFPVRWTAPEAMEAYRFTAASDIWSFGITMVEVCVPLTWVFSMCDDIQLARYALVLLPC